MNERIRQVCPYEKVTEEVCIQALSILEGDKNYRNLIAARPDPEEITAKRKECDRHQYNYMGCSGVWPAEREKYCGHYQVMEKDCRQQLEVMLKGDIMSTNEKKAELARLNAAILYNERYYAMCLEQPRWTNRLVLG
jgi:hypothetical protein